MSKDNQLDTTPSSTSIEIKAPFDLNLSLAIHLDEQALLKNLTCLSECKSFSQLEERKQLIMLKFVHEKGQCFRFWVYLRNDARSI